jgi:hypothetical protein
VYGSLSAYTLIGKVIKQTLAGMPEKAREEEMRARSAIRRL